MKKHDTRSARGKSARQRGNQFEVQLMNLLKQYGYEATTARYSSKKLDDSGVDIDTNAPFNIQAKYVERLAPSMHDILRAMPKGGKPNVVFHKRAHKGITVTMDVVDFCDLLLYKEEPKTFEE